MLDPYALLTVNEFVHTQESGYRASAVPKCDALGAMAELERRIRGVEAERDDLKSNLRDAGKLLIEGRGIMDELEGQCDVLLAACKNYVRQYALVNKKVMGKTADLIHKAVTQVEGKG